MDLSDTPLPIAFLLPHIATAFHDVLPAWCQWISSCLLVITLESKF